LAIAVLSPLQRVHHETAAWCRVCKHYAHVYDEWSLCT
jgi:hypothetical protein